MVRSCPPEREESVRSALRQLRHAYQLLEFGTPHIPAVEVRFDGGTDTRLVTGHVEVRGDTVVVLYDARLLNPADEASVISTNLPGSAYPGVTQTLTHELAHTALWDIINEARCPATRLLDEGWATLVERSGLSDVRDTTDVYERARHDAARVLREQPESFARCMELARPIQGIEDLNGAEYDVGCALLAWVHERGGPSSVRTLLGDARAFMLNGEGASATPSAGYSTDAAELQGQLARGEVDQATAERLAQGREGRRVEDALLRATGTSTPSELRRAFEAWIVGLQ